MKKTLIILGLLVLLAVLYYLISPLFITRIGTEIDPSTQHSASSSTSVSTSTHLRSTERAPIVDTKLHPASGYVRIVHDGEKNFVRYEELKTINGPDIFVYLAKDIDAKEFVNLGKVKVTEGTANYEIPSSVDPSQYPYVLIWCKAFDVLFNYAKVY